MISRAELQEMFDSIAENAGWDMSQDMVWGYFFTHSAEAPLERAAEALESQGYAVVDLYLADK